MLIFTCSVVGIAIAMHALKRRLLLAEERQRRMAERDPLTGLHNRRAFDAALAEEMARGEVALVLFDFDGFKAINDVYGHPVGDAVLCTVADACRDAGREVDHLSRLGGDEFALIAPGAGAAGVERIVGALEDAITPADMPRASRSPPRSPGRSRPRTPTTQPSCCAAPTCACSPASAGAACASTTRAAPPQVRSGSGVRRAVPLTSSSEGAMPQALSPSCVLVSERRCIHQDMTGPTAVTTGRARRAPWR